MFETGPILALQQASPDAWVAILAWLSAAISQELWATVFLLVTYAVHYRKGFTLIQAALLNGVLTDVLKGAFALPRPVDVDARVLLMPGRHPNPAPFVAGGAPGFWARLPDGVVAHFRTIAGGSAGFPSGHCSSTALAGGGLALFFRRRVVAVLGAVLTVLVALSRMTLGRHFLADVLGGTVLGLAVAGAAAGATRAEASRSAAAAAGRPAGRLSPWVLAYLLAAPCVVLSLPGADAAHAARLAGINLGFLAVAWRGLPEESGSAADRGLRFTLAAGLYAAARAGFGALLAAAGLAERPGPEAAAELAGGFLVIWGATEAGVGLRLFRRSSPGSRDEEP